MSISALDKNTAKLLTTTQVVTSVSSAVKELIENALDAGATSIEINLTDNGSSVIEVKDNAWGISKEDAPYMALPSYTSKISSFSDLECLHTYGFRGEALCALCTVADVTVITKTAQDEAAVSYTMDHDGRILKSEPYHRATGTTVQVRQLFKDIPVRRQIITNVKKAKQEVKVVEALVKCYGICQFLVRISCRVDKNVLLAKPSANSMKEAVTYVLGKAVVGKMHWIEVEEPEINMRLMIPSKDAGNTPEIFQSGAQYIFVNERPVKHKELEKLMSKTIAEGLAADSSSKKKPVFVLHISTDPSNIDVNLEPNKTSVIFKEQQTVLDIVDKSLRNHYEIDLLESPKEDEHNTSAYQDYTHTVRETDSENVWPACKKRKLEVESLVTEESIAAGKSVNGTKADVQTCENNPDARNRSSDLEIFTSQLIPPDLSESDTNDTEDFARITGNSTSEPNESKDDSPPFEFSPSTPAPSSEANPAEIQSVDTADSFDWGEYFDNSHAKENRTENAKTRQEPGKNATLDAWSKGHVTGVKGGTDVRPFVLLGDAPPVKPSWNKSSDRSSTSTAISLFSRHVYNEITKQNPTLSPALIGQKVAQQWKSLSSEERGFYKDLAREKQLEREQDERTKKEESIKKEAANVESGKNRKRLLKMLENMKKLNVEKKENLVQRTTVLWETDFKRIAGSRLDKTTWGGTSAVIGQLSRNLWTAKMSGHVCLFDVARLREELNIRELDTGQNEAESVERDLKRWLSERDDLSPLHLIYPLQKKR